MDASKYIRPGTLEDALEYAKEIRRTLGTTATQKKSRIYPLWSHRYMSGPETWLITAYSISPIAQWVSLILWQQWRLNRGKQPLKLTGRALRKFGVSRFSAYRALNALEKAGLITLQRFKHRSPLITIANADKAVKFRHEEI